MKKYVLALTLLILFVIGLSATDFVSNPDEYNSMLINPAAQSYFNNTTIAYERFWTKNDRIKFTTERRLYLNLRNIGYALSTKGSNHHTLSSSNILFSNLYFGNSYDWSGKHFNKGSYNVSFLYRPFNLISFGTQISDILDKHNHKADFGISLRPIYLNGDFWDKFDINFASSYFQGELAKPAIGLKMELIDGITIKGDYNLENKATTLGFSINFGTIETGGNFKSIDNSSSGNYFLKTSARPQRSIKDFITRFKPAYYDYKISGKLVETVPQELKIGFIEIKTGKYVTLRQIKSVLEKLSKKDNIKGIIIQSPKTKFGISDVQELKPAFEKFRKSGKKIIFYFNGISASDYLIAASLGDEIYVNPLGEVNLPKLGVKAPYIKELLGKLGINVQNFKSHKYKTAGNMFTESEMTEAEKETYEALLKDISSSIKELITENRGTKFADSWDNILEKKPFFDAKEALDLGLIDGITYQTDLRKALAKNNKKPLIVKHMAIDTTTDWAKKPTSKVAIIYAVGNIHMGKSPYGKSIGSETISQAIRKARKDKSVKGIIIRVDSGGGSALASDIIAHEVELARKENKKPVVISMGRVAASGGYYISALADKIIAHPGTITGSIGVIGMIPEFSKLYQKIGVNWSSLKINKFAGFPPTNRPMNNDEKKYIEDSIHKIYWDFVGVVAKGRHKDKNEVHKIAQGRVWSGLSAFKLGLIDDLGGLDKAKEEIKNLAHLKHKIRLVEYRGKSKNPFAFTQIGTNVALSAMPKELKDTYNLFKNFSLYQNEQVLMLTPIKLELK